MFCLLFIEPSFFSCLLIIGGLMLFIYSASKLIEKLIKDEENDKKQS